MMSALGAALLMDANKVQVPSLQPCPCESVTQGKHVSAVMLDCPVYPELHRGDTQ